MDRLDESSLRDLYRATRRLLRQAVRARADVDQLPRGYLLRERHAGGRCPRCGRDLARLTIGMRTTYYCRNEQRHAEAEAGVLEPVTSLACFTSRAAQAEVCEMEIKRILCPVDLSEVSRHAMGHARALARWYEAEIVVLHVFTVPLPYTPTPRMAEAYPPLPPPEEIADGVRRFYGFSQDPRVKVIVVEGTPSKEIVRHAEMLRADLLVMGTHGRGGFEGLFLGSVTEKVLRSTHVPVLTVPPPVEHVETVVYRTILCPTEFSDPSTRALEYALTLAEETTARLVLLHVIEGFIEDKRLITEASHFSVPEYYRHLESEARARLTSAVPEQARIWCTPEERVMFGRAYRVILQVAEEVNADVIVMGVHGKGALNRRLFGSTTHHVIREARCPVLTLRG